jgi:hypothetical protein
MGGTCSTQANIIKNYNFESEFLKEVNPVNFPSPFSIKDGELSISSATVILPIMTLQF